MVVELPTAIEFGMITHEEGRVFRGQPLPVTRQGPPVLLFWTPALTHANTIDIERPN